MFNSQKWTGLIEDAYGYAARTYKVDATEFHYTAVGGGADEYIVAPAFGDFIHFGPEIHQILNKWTDRYPQVPGLVKLRSNSLPVVAGFLTEKSGYIHELEYNSYDEWKSKRIKCKFRNQINQGFRNGLTTKISREKCDVLSFWELHAKLRIGKFFEIPQPQHFFSNIVEEYFRRESGFLISAYTKTGNLVGGIIVITSEGTAYYKYAASDPSAIKLRPNNFLIDRLVRYLEEQGIYKLNFGFTGDSINYDGLRKFKVATGAGESNRYILKTPSFLGIDRSAAIELNAVVRRFIQSNPNLDQINQFSSNNYMTFV